MDFFIPKSFFGSNKNILVQNNSEIKYIEEDYSTTVNNIATIKDIFYFNGFELLNPIPEQYLKSMECFSLKEDIPWELIIPKETYGNIIKDYINLISQKLSQCRLTYYDNHYKDITLFLDSLCESKIDSSLLKKYHYKEDDLGNQTILKSFIPNKGTNVLAAPKYGTKTKTGRLKIIEGPNILRLKKEHRNIIQSSFGDNGKIYYLDYKSLEPRTLLGINKSNEDIPFDVYEYIIEKLKLNNINREQIKKVVLSLIFGLGETKLKEELKKDNIENVDDFIEAINSFFGTKELKENIILSIIQHDKTGFYNFYDRFIETIDMKPYMAINYLIQSSSVDIALIGFSKIYKYLIDYNLIQYIRPIFVLHDALILDIHKEYKNYIQTLESIGSIIPKLKHVRFYLDSRVLE